MYTTAQRLKLFPSKYQRYKDTHCCPWENDSQTCRSGHNVLLMHCHSNHLCQAFATSSGHLIDINLPRSRSADRIRWTDSIFLEYTMCCDEVRYLVSLNFIKSVIKLHFSLNSPKTLSPVSPCGALAGTLQRRFYLLVILPYSQWRCEHCFLCACMVSPGRVVFGAFEVYFLVRLSVANFSSSPFVFFFLYNFGGTVAECSTRDTPTAPWFRSLESTRTNWADL